MPPEDLRAWERAGPMLAARRAQLSPRYANRREFARDTGLNWRTLHDAERAKRANFKDETLRAFEAAYALVPGSLDRTLAGGDLEAALPEPPRPPATRALAAVPDDADEDAVIEMLIAGERDDEKREVMEQAWRFTAIPRAGRLKMLRSYLEEDAGEEQGERGERRREPGA